jgi:hypothetical protein
VQQRGQQLPAAQQTAGFAQARHFRVGGRTGLGLFHGLDAGHVCGHSFRIRPFKTGVGQGLQLFTHLSHGNGRRGRGPLCKCRQQFGGGHKALVAAEVGQRFHQQHLVGAALVYQHGVGGLGRLLRFMGGGVASLLYFRGGFAGLLYFRGGFAAPVKGGGKLRLSYGLITITHKLSKAMRREPAFPWSWYRPHR